jgi:hypothetical protein
MSDALQREFAATDEPVTFLVILREQLDANQVLAAADVQAAERTVRAATLYSRADRARCADTAGADLVAGSARCRLSPILHRQHAGRHRRRRTLAGALLQRSEVDRLEANPQVASLNAMPSALPRGWSMAPAEEATASATLPWGLGYTHAPEVWAQGLSRPGDCHRQPGHRREVGPSGAAGRLPWLDHRTQ